MPVRIRLRRMGKKKQPFYRIIAVDSRGRRDGKYLDKIGHYNPRLDPAEILIDEDKALLWLGRGAEPSNTVKSMFRKQGLLFKFHLIKQGFDEDRITEEMKKWEVLQLDRQKRQEAEAIQRQREQEKAKADKEASEETAAAEVEQANAQEETSEVEAKQEEPVPEPETSETEEVKAEADENATVEATVTEASESAKKTEESKEG